MKRFISILCVLFVTAILSFDCDAQLVWRETNRDINVPSVIDPVVSDGVEIFVTQGSLIVRTNRRIQVRVFTILGQLVSQANVNPGTAELKMNSRGIYIVKIGNITQKIAL